MSDNTDPTNVQAEDNTEVQVEDLEGGHAAAGAYSVATSLNCFAA